MADIPDVDLSKLGVTNYGTFSVDVVDSVGDYLELMEVTNLTRSFVAFLKSMMLRLGYGYWIWV